MCAGRRLFSRSVAEMVKHNNGSDVDKRRKARIKYLQLDIWYAQWSTGNC